VRVSILFNHSETTTRENQSYDAGNSHPPLHHFFCRNVYWIEM
jgi:hypothetical protein